MAKKVFLIGCGTGDPELLTVKALKTFQKLDVALVDHLISEEIIDLLPKRTKILYVGKQKGKLSIRQDEINKLLLAFAKAGLTVGRLKSGDPYVFGRGGEEALFLLENGVEVEVIPGVSSATVAPMYAGIPVVMRGFSTGFSVVSAHLAGNRFNKEWIPLLKQENHTVIVLMGLSRAKEILEEAKKQKIDLDKPVAIISNATRENQKVITGKLEDLPLLAKKAEKPAVLVFGEVVNLHEVLPTYKYVNQEKGESVWKSC